MFKKILDLLICPYCGSGIVFQKIIVEENNEVKWALLSCKECKCIYPVIESIPIIMPSNKRINVFAQTKKSSIEKDGPSVSEICRLLINEQIESVRELLIYVMPYKKYVKHDIKDILPKKISDIRGSLGRRIINKILQSSYFDRHWKKSIKVAVESKSTSAFEVMQIYYQSHELFNYFFYKFGQPRFLNSLGLASIVGKIDKPILDLACGQGHLMHYLTLKYCNSTVIGLDRNYFQLFLAKKYVAPKGHYVCAEADEKLPFKNNIFGSIICSDSFHYFQNKLSCVIDLEKLIENYGVIILNRIGNRNLSPNEGVELTLRGYKNLFQSVNTLLIDDDEILARYLKKRKPNLSFERDIQDLSEKKWLSIIASKNDRIFLDHGNFDEWPHATGQLNLNPLYQKVGTDKKNNEIYEFSFPSEWYHFEDCQWQSYAPKKVKIPKKIIRKLENNEWDYGMKYFIDRFVILGFPINYF